LCKSRRSLTLRVVNFHEISNDFAIGSSEVCNLYVSQLARTRRKNAIWTIKEVSRSSTLGVFRWHLKIQTHVTRISRLDAHVVPSGNKDFRNLTVVSLLASKLLAPIISLSSASIVPTYDPSCRVSMANALEGVLVGIVPYEIFVPFKFFS